jgi:hypothetical protein
MKGEKFKTARSLVMRMTGSNGEVLESKATREGLKQFNAGKARRPAHGFWSKWRKVTAHETH